MRSHNASSDRRGSTLILTLLLMMGAFALLAFAVDLGYIQVTSTELRRSADSAAIASAWSLLTNSPMGGGSSCTASNEALAAANQYAALNRVGSSQPTLGASDIVVGYLQNPSDPSEPIKTDADPNRFNAVRIRVRRASDQNGEVPLFFARVLGQNSVPNKAEATAAFLNNFSGFQTPSSGSALGILPFALDEETWNKLLQGQTSDDWKWDDVHHTITAGHDGVREANLFPQDVGAPGNRGTVDIGRANNSTNDIKRQITSGITADDLSYIGGKLELDANGQTTLNGDTGISAGVEAALISIKGQTRIIPIFRSVSGNGNNAEYTIIGFAGVRIMDVDLNGSKDKKRVIIQPARVSAMGGIPGGDSQTSQYIFSPVWLVR